MSLWNKPFTPMLLKEIAKPFNSKDYLFELKYDGERALIFASPHKVIIKNRHNDDITSVFPELQAIKDIVKTKTIFDGEIVSFSKGYPSFSLLQQRAHLKNKIRIERESINNPVVFICFDILYLDKDLTNLSLLARKEILNKIQDNDYFVKIKYILNNGLKLYDFVKNKKMEGIVAKEKNSIYEIKQRSNSWLKIKNYLVETFYILGYIDEQNIVSLILGECNLKQYIFVGKVIMSKKNNLYQKLLKVHKSKLYFHNYNESKAIILEPKLKCQVKYIERTKNNHLRQPVLM